MFDLSRLDEPTAGFGHCPKCIYLTNDSAAICYACARQTIEPLAPAQQRCDICDQVFTHDDGCHNPVCAMGQRWFDWNFAISMRTGMIKNVINAYKYDGMKGWGVIFSRMLVGFLEARHSTFEDFDYIIPSPTYIGPEPEARKWDHTRAVIESAASHSAVWPFYVNDPPLIVKTAMTPKFTGRRYRERRDIAETELRAALQVPDPGRTKGLSILVYDDVFTDGLTLREVARSLIEAGGAERVCGVSLTRQPFGS